MKDVTILYQGGSGGFVLYYYLLLTGKYQYDIETVQSMIARQFPSNLSTDPASWKNKEFWPDNFDLKSKSGSKIFLVCNPLLDPSMYQINQTICKGTHKIFLYTDIHLQLRMAWEKRAYWFTDFSRQKLNAPDNNWQYLRWILGSVDQFKDNTVESTLLDVINKFEPDQTVRLQDFINTKTLNNFATPNQAQIDFLNHWKSLQPKKAFKMFLD